MKADFEKTVEGFDLKERKRPAELVDRTLIFIYQDLSILNHVEKMKVGVDIFYYLLTQGQPNEKIIRIAIEHIEEVLNIQEIYSIQNALKSHFEEHFLPLINGEIEKSPEFNSLTTVEEEIEWFEVDNGVLSRRLFRTEFKKIEDRAINHFRENMARIMPESVAAFQKCEECNRIFFPYGKRTRSKRRFCSHACNLKYNAKERRKKAKEQNSPEA
jgi:hypothetical protein